MEKLNSLPGTRLPKIAVFILSGLGDELKNLAVKLVFSIKTAIDFLIKKVWCVFAR